MACWYVGQSVTGGVVTATVVPGVTLGADDVILSSAEACFLHQSAAVARGEAEDVAVAIGGAVIAVALLFAGWRIALRIIRGAASA